MTNMVLLQSTLHDIQDIAIATIPDGQLAKHLCKKRAIFSLPYTTTGSHTVECLLPLRQVASPYPYREEYVITRWTTNNAVPLTVLQIALVRDCLLEAGCGMLHDACSRPPWTVRPEDRHTGYSFLGGNKLGTQHSTWKLNADGSGGQMTILSLEQYFSTHRKQISNLRLSLSTRGN